MHKRDDTPKSCAKVLQLGLYPNMPSFMIIGRKNKIIAYMNKRWLGFVFLGQREERSLAWIYSKLTFVFLVRACIS